MSDAFWPGPMVPQQVVQRLRSYFPGHGNWQSDLENSGLPGDVKSLIADIVQQTGLLRFEKSEIATDLVNHFRDGHERGHSFDELVRDFGKTEVAISLFRSSKLRSRPVSVKAFRGSIAVFGGGIVGYILLQIFFHSAKPNPTVDYSAKLNEVVTSMPEDQKAWPFYRDTWAKHGLVESGNAFKELWFEEESVDDTTHLRLIRPTDSGWDHAVQKLDSIKELLVALREGSKRPYVGVPLHLDRSKYSDDELAVMSPTMSREQLEALRSESVIDSFGLDIDPISKEADKLLSESIFGILLPHIQQFRRAARILRVDTRYAMQQGDQQRAVENVNTIMRLGKQAGNNPIVVCSLVGVAIRAIGMEVVEELVTEHGDQLSDESLENLQKAVARVDFESAYDLTFEKNFALDFIQRIYSDDGAGDGRMTAVGAEVLYVLKSMNGVMGESENPWQQVSLIRKAAGPVQMLSAPSRKEMEALVEELHLEIVEHFDTRMWEEGVAPDRKSIEKRDPTGLLDSTLYSMSNLKQGREVRIAQQDAVLLALALFRFKRENETWPTSLDDLKNEWIDRTPIDRLSGKPLSFTIRDDQPIVYSWGRDGENDGGVWSETVSNAPWLDQEDEGDWILWPTRDL